MNTMKKKSRRIKYVDYTELAKKRYKRSKDIREDKAFSEEEEIADAMKALESYPPYEEDEDSGEALSEEEEIADALDALKSGMPPLNIPNKGIDSNSGMPMGKDSLTQASGKALLDADIMEYAEKYPQTYVYCKKTCEKDRYRYLDEPESGAPLYRDNGRYWEPVSDERLQVIVYELLTEEDKAQIYDCKKFCTNVTSFIKYECARRYHAGERFTDEDFKAIENHAVFRNCVYDLQNNRMLPFNTKLPYFFGLNADYIKYDVETKAWDKLKNDASGDPDSMDMTDFWTAYLGIANRSAKQFGVPAPEKNSGKTTYGEFLVDMFEGTRAEAIDPDKLSGQFAYAKAATTLLYYCFDINTDQLKPREVSEIKKLTGEKYIRSEAKYQMATTVPIRFKVMLATNTGLYLSKGSHQDDAFYNRVLVLPFIHSRENGEMDNNMLDKLCEERSAILSKCMRKLGRLIRPDGGITIPESELSRSIKLSWMYKIDMVELFMQSKLVVTGEMEDAIPKEDLHAEYVDFCHEKGKELDLRSCPILDSRGCANKIVDLARGKAVAKRLRRGTRENPLDVILRPCITGLRWKEEQPRLNYKRF